jgi:hypothetical protein
MKPPRFLWLFVALVTLSGCATVRNILGVVTPGDPTIELKSAETRWLLIKNPRFGDVRSEPEYIWVEENKVPTTITTLIRGKGAIIAPPEVVAKYGPPPGGGKISPRQGIAIPTAEASAPARAPVAEARAAGSASAAPTATRTDATPAPPPAEPPKRGFVVYVDTSRIVVDLTATDGLRPGTIVSLRRDRIPIIHPITGEVLGELDDEVATARITETRDRFSVAEVQSVAPGAQIQVRDRVVPK